MAKLPLLRGMLQKPAAALFLAALLQPGFYGAAASAEGEDAPRPALASGDAPSGEGKAEEAATPAARGEASAQPPADAKPAGEAPGQPNPQAAPQDGKAEVKPAGAKPGEAPGQPNPEAAPQDGKAEVRPAGAKPGEDAKPGESGKPAAKAAESRAGEQKEALAPPKPKEPAPRSDTSESLAVKASNVNAVYRIHWLGTYIGDFKLRSSITNRQYSLQANADISVFFGTVSWRGFTSSHGLMTANGPAPQNYSFRYAANERREAVEMRFQQKMVQDIVINPPSHPGSRIVPITAAHLQNVVDPLSAVVLLSQARLSRRNADACTKRLPIFDGKVRYDIVLSPKGTRTVGSTGKLRGIAYVCRVNYVPIAGHRPGKQGGNDYATGNTGIEIWLVPVPEAGLIVPYYVHIPTPAGTASMVAAKFDVETPSGRHALAE